MPHSRISSTFEQDTNCKVLDPETDTVLDQTLGTVMGSSVLHWEWAVIDENKMATLFSSSFYQEVESVLHPYM